MSSEERGTRPAKGASYSEVWAIRVAERAVEYGRMIKFSHSIFLLPFALCALLLVPASEFRWGSIPLILLALAAARSAAMGFNRIVDRDLDAANPRTRSRAIPSGRIRVGEAWRFVFASSFVFLTSASLLNTTSMLLAPFALALILGYSYTKRFTWLSHLILGVATSLAPAGAWIGMTGSLELRIGLLVGAVAFWVCGFDILYACLDVEFDRRWRLYSIPHRFGLRRALGLAKFTHLLSLISFAALGWAFELGWLYWVGVGMVGLLMAVEHSLVSERNLSRLNEAFFLMNGLISVVYLLFMVMERTL